MLNRIVLTIALSISMLAVAVTANAGPIFLTGHDPDFHAQGEAGARNLLTAGLAFATGGAYVAGATFSGASTLGAGKFLWVEGRPGDPGPLSGGVPGGHLIGENGLGVVGLSLGTDYDRVNAAELALLTDFSAYTAIAVASSFGGLLTRAELDGLISRKTDIETFINAGGGLFASAECSATGGICGANLLGGTTAPDLFGFLPVDVTSIGVAGPFTLTPFGATLGLVTSDLQSPTHNAFGLVGGLSVVDTDTAGNAVTLAGNVTVGGGGFTPVPEPSTVLLFGTGVLGLIGYARRRQNNK